MNWTARIDGVNYPIAEENGQVLWQTVHTEDQPERWDDWSLGLGEHYISCEGFDATTKNVLRFSPFYHNDNNPSDLTTARGYFMEDVKQSGSTLTLDAYSTAKGSLDQSETLTQAHTVASQSNRLLIVGIAIDGRVTSVKFAGEIGVAYAGQPMTYLGGKMGTTNVDASVGLYFLSNPPTGANNIVVTNIAAPAVTYAVVMGAASLYNVDLDAPFGSAVTGTNTDGTPTITVTPVSGEQIPTMPSQRGLVRPKDGMMLSLPM